MRVSYRNEFGAERVQTEFPEFALRFFKVGGSKIYRTTSTADQRAFVMAEIAKSRNVAPNGGGLINEGSVEIVEPDGIDNDDNDDCILWV